MFSYICFCLQDFVNIVRLLLAGSINGLTTRVSYYIVIYPSRNVPYRCYIVSPCTCDPSQKPLLTNRMSYYHHIAFVDGPLQKPPLLTSGKLCFHHKPFANVAPYRNTSSMPYFCHIPITYMGSYRTLLPHSPLY